jgi:hypothetical protein
MMLLYPIIHKYGSINLVNFHKFSIAFTVYLQTMAAQTQPAVKTTGLAGGLLTPYKGLLLAKPKGLLKKIPLLQYMLRYPTGTICLWYLYYYDLFAHMSQTPLF